MSGSILLLMVAALCALCLAMPRHFTKAWQREPRASHALALRGVGSIALAAAAALAIRASGIGVGLALWCGTLTLAGVIVVVCNAYRPRGVWPMAVAAAVGALALMLTAPPAAWR
jgi:Protein of unknown function (DUF3325)